MFYVQFVGDIGQWLPNGTMKIIDRRQTILKLAQVSLNIIKCKYIT